MEANKRKYGLFTAISMIIGVVIGSGIFFKSDDILNKTGGNIGLGVLSFCIGAFSIIFGSLTVSELAVRSDNLGGVIGYYEDYISGKVASGFAWFQYFIYYPALGMAISWVGGSYLCSLFGLNPTLEMCGLLGFSAAFILFIVNIISEKIGIYFQNLSTIIKLLPIFIIAIVGFILVPQDIKIPDNVPIVLQRNVGFGWIAALPAVAFSYEGWIIATNMSGDVKNPKKTMPLALTIAPLIVLVAYVLYFLGITKMLGAEYIMSLGNIAINKAGNIVFGPYGDKILLVFIVIAVLGVVNGVVMGMLRLPGMMKSKKMLPSKSGEDFNEISFKNSLIPILLCAFWMLINFILKKFNILLGSNDVSMIAVVFGYAFYSILYIKVMTMKEISSATKRLLFPICGLIGATIILIGGFSANNHLYTIFYLILCILIFAVGNIYYKKNNHIN